MSPSVRSMLRPAGDPVGRRAACAGPEMAIDLRRASARGRRSGPCGSRGPGTLPTAGARRSGLRARAHHLGIARQRGSARWSSACARRGPGAAGAAARRGCAQERVDRGEVEIACCARELASAGRSGGSRSPATSSAVERRLSAVRAEGAVASCGGRRGRRSARSPARVERRAGCAPSNLARPAKATWSTSMLRPMPIASVATR